jgi:hypothetical protein
MSTDRHQPPAGPAPTLDAYRARDRAQLQVFCAYERTWHLHGAVGRNPGDGDGHRAAHCLKDTPYASTGYILREQAGQPAIRRRP